jgi:CBS domain-containing protein
MLAQDVMVRDVVTVKPDTRVSEAVKLLAEHDVSALPVVDDARIGRRSERSGFAGTAGDRHTSHRSSPIEALRPASELAEQFLKAHGKSVTNLMSVDLIVAHEDTPVSEIATLLECNRIKRVPIVRGKTLVVIVSRSNLIQAMASQRRRPATVIPIGLFDSNCSTGWPASNGRISAKELHCRRWHRPPLGLGRLNARRSPSLRAKFRAFRTSPIAY